MKSGRCRIAALAGALALTALRPEHARAQLLGSMQLNQGIGADNDFPPFGHSSVTNVTDTSIPFQKTASANDGTGAYVTATYNIGDNGSMATISISASGSVSANGNAFIEGTNSPYTNFTLLATCNYTATMGVTGPTDAEFYIFDGNSEDFGLSASQSFPTDSAIGVMPPGPIDFFEYWGLLNGYNDAPQSADESGSYSLTLTLTAIPEPSSAALLAISAAVALCRRRRRIGAALVR